MPWVAAAVVGGVAVIGSIESNKAQQSATATAASAEQSSTAQANKTTMQMFASEQADMAPYMAMGINAGNALSGLMGLGSVASGTGAQKQVTATDVVRNQQTAQNAANAAYNKQNPTPKSGGGGGGGNSTTNDALGAMTGGASDVMSALGFGLAKGGTTPAKPYMVGEHGPETLINKYGRHVVGQSGPEIIHPTTPGFIQPNPVTAAHNETASKNWLEGARMSPIHRAVGGNVMGSGDGFMGGKFGGKFSGLMGADSGDTRMGTGYHTVAPMGYAAPTGAQTAPPTGAQTAPPTRGVLNPGAGTSRGNVPQATAPVSHYTPPPGSNIVSGMSKNTPGTGTTGAQTSADTLLGQGLGAGYNAAAADSTSSKVLSQSPQYQFAMQQGIEGLDASAAASGGLLSGGHLAAILNYSQGLASQQYNNVYNQLMGVTSVGEAAAAGQATNAAVTGSQLSNNYMTNGANQGNAAYASGNANANMWSGIVQGIGSGVGMMG